MFSATNVTYPSDVIVDDTQVNVISYDGGAPYPFGKGSNTWVDTATSTGYIKDYLIYNDTFVYCSSSVCLANFTFTGTRVAVYGLEITGTPRSTYTLEGPGYSSTAMHVASNGATLGGDSSPRFSVQFFRSEELPYATYLLKINATGSPDVTAGYMLDWIAYNVSSPSQSSQYTPTALPAPPAKSVIPRGLVAGYVIGSLLLLFSAVFLGVMFWRRRRYSQMVIESEDVENKESRSGRLDLLDPTAPSPGGNNAHSITAQGLPGGRARAAHNTAPASPLPTCSTPKPSPESAAGIGASESDLNPGEAAPSDRPKQKRHDGDAEVSQNYKGKGKASEKGLLPEGGQGSGCAVDALPVYEP